MAGKNPDNDPTFRKVITDLVNEFFAMGDVHNLESAERLQDAKACVESCKDAGSCPSRAAIKAAGGRTYRP